MDRSVAGLKGQGQVPGGDDGVLQGASSGWVGQVDAIFDRVVKGGVGLFVSDEDQARNGAARVLEDSKHRRKSILYGRFPKVPACHRRPISQPTNAEIGMAINTTVIGARGARSSATRVKKNGQIDALATVTAAAAANRDGVGSAAPMTKRQTM
ncbi:hypothetical protein [Roseobacter sp. HKCCA0434]|uniref:hypothetical protein n=1 Tax=Roseobacter sp. HKCCA0434 TaxID=3079297 RepID=UPI002905ED58|nr:hypothetical protein [Roseobacter sp. HKCCA0434]